MAPGRNGPPPDEGRLAPAPDRLCADDIKGSLILIGGACSAEGGALATFVRIAGATNVEFPIVDRRARAQEDGIADSVRHAAGIFLGGGDQVHLVATIGGSKVGDAIREAY